MVNEHVNKIHKNITDNNNKMIIKEYDMIW